jgi:hypothetical protein
MAQTVKPVKPKKRNLLQFIKENTGDYICTHPIHSSGGVRVLKRDRKHHDQVDKGLALASGKNLNRPPNVVGKDQGAPQRKPSPSPPPVSPLKKQARDKRGQNGVPVSNPSPQPTPKAPTGNAHPAGPGGAISWGFQQWADQTPSNLEELEIWLFTAKQGLEQAARFIEQGAQNAIIGQNLHPDIAKPLYEAAATTAESGVDYARAYHQVLRIYRPAIEYRELNAPKPAAGFFEQGGTA